MQSSLETLNALSRRLNVVVPNADVQAKFQKEYSKQAKSVRAPGFRAGKVPARVLKDMGLDAQIQAQIMQTFQQDAIEQLVKDHQVEFVARPEVKVDTDGAQDTDLAFSVEFEVYPDVDLTQVTGTALEKTVASVSAEDIEKTKQNIAKESAEWTDLSEDDARPVQAGDRVKVMMSRTVDGEEKEPAAANHLLVDQSQLLTELYDGLLGHTVGETLNISATYPDNWSEAALAGKAVQFEITIDAIQTRTPLSDEALLKQFGSFESMDDLNAYIEKHLQEQADKVAREQFQEVVLEALQNLFADLPLPEGLMTQETATLAQQQSKADTDESVLDEAKKRVRLGVVINAIIKKHALKPDQKRMIDHVQQMAMQFGGASPEMLKSFFSNQNLMRSVERMVLLDQAVDVIMKDMSVTEKSVSFDDLVNAQ